MHCQRCLCLSQCLCCLLRQVNFEKNRFGGWGNLKTLCSMFLFFSSTIAAINLIFFDGLSMMYDGDE